MEDDSVASDESEIEEASSIKIEEEDESMPSILICDPNIQG